MPAAPIAKVDHSMTRLNIATGIAFDDFVTAFEREAPTFDPAPFLKIADEGGTWEQIEAVTAAFAPHGLIVYARIDTAPMVALAGITVHAIEYLLGNHVIAATMFRRDPNAMLYAPLRVLIFDDDGQAVFAIDRPATVFAGLADDDIAATGVLLDGKLAGLLFAIGVDVRDALA